MKILFMTESLDVGGIEINIKRLSEELTLREHEVLVAARSGSLNQQIELTGARIIDLKMSITSPIKVLVDILRLRPFLKENEIVHIFSAKAGLLCWFASHLLFKKRRPVVVASLMGIHNKSEKEPLYLTKLRAKLTLLGAETVISTSPAIRKVLDKVKTKKQKVIDASVVGVEIFEEPSKKRVLELKKELGIKPDERIISTIGRLAKSKSHHLFIKAAKIVLKTKPDSYFLIVGDGPLKNELQEVIDQEGITKNVHLIGERHDIKEILSASDVYVRPGIVEGFVGITVLEAQSLKKPVIGFETEDLQVAITHKISGWLVPKNNFHELGEAICQLLDDPVLKAEISKTGYEQFLKHFSVKAIVDNLCSIYDELKSSN